MTKKEATLKIGNSDFEHLGKVVSEFGNVIATIFEKGFENRMEQETINCVG